MAKRRMFSLDIIDHDNFIDMPLSAQALYMHLSMRSDDDGFITPKRIMRMIGSQEDDLKLLIAKRFVIRFESGVVVIKHWPINNMVRKDRYTETNFKKEKQQLGLNSNGAYTEIENSVKEITPVSNTVVNQMATKWQPKVNTGKVRLGKVSNKYKVETQRVYDHFISSFNKNENLYHLNYPF